MNNNDAGKEMLNAIWKALDMKTEEENAENAVQDKRCGRTNTGVYIRLCRVPPRHGRQINPSNTTQKWQHVSVVLPVKTHARALIRRGMSFSATKRRARALRCRAPRNGRQRRARDGGKATASTKWYGNAGACVAVKNKSGRRQHTARAWNACVYAARVVKSGRNGVHAYMARNEAA